MRFSVVALNHPMLNRYWNEEVKKWTSFKYATRFGYSWMAEEVAYNTGGIVMSLKAAEFREIRCGP